MGSLSDISEHRWEADDCYLLPHVKQKFNEWYSKGYNIIITTGRPESMRQLTENQLNYFHLFYDQLIMGIKYYKRVLINDNKSDGTITAFAYPLQRNDGFRGIDI